jgi:hypothetical protein
MEHNESLIINSWENPEEQLLQIEKEIQGPQIEDRRIFLEDYKQALLEFLDIFDSNGFLKKRYDYIHVATDESESLASELFLKYSLWNYESGNYDINLIDEWSIVNSYLSDLLGLKEMLLHLKEFLNLFSTADSNEKFVNECIAHFSLSRSDIQFILSLPLSELKNANPQTIKDDIDKYSAISEFLIRISCGFWERQVEEDDNAEVTYFYDSKKKEWEKISKMEYEPSFKDYTWDKQNEKWQLLEDDDTV